MRDVDTRRTCVVPNKQLRRGELADVERRFVTFRHWHFLSGHVADALVGLERDRYPAAAQQLRRPFAVRKLYHGIVRPMCEKARGCGIRLFHGPFLFPHRHRPGHVGAHGEDTADPVLQKPFSRCLEGCVCTG